MPLNLGSSKKDFHLLPLVLRVRPFIFNLLVYETGDHILSKGGKIFQIAGFYFMPMVEKTLVRKI